jgi:hypothetical protein
MKRKLILLVMLLLTAMIISGCDVTGITPPISENPELTPEEIALIRKWGYGGDYVVRWPDGYVDVYDATNYNQMQKVLNQWNAAIGGKVILRLSNNPNSQVKVYYKSMFVDCGNFDIKWNEDYALTTIDVQISDNAFFCGYPSSKYSLYLFMFKSVAGFAGWTTKKVPFEEWTNFTTINDTMKKMVKALHKVPPGYCLTDEQEIEFEGYGTSYVCSGCWGGHISYFAGFNVIDYYDNSYVTIWPKNNEKLPDSIAIILKGIKWIPEKTSWDDNIKTVTSYNNAATNGYEITKVNDQIQIKLFKDFSSSFNAVPWKEVKLYVYRMPSGKLLGSYNFKEDGGIIPRVKSNFGQCVWWACKRKWETDQKMPPFSNNYPFYPCLGCEKTEIISSSYIPKDHDVLIYYEDPDHPEKLGHYAFVESVKNNGNGTYSIEISQYNVIHESYDKKILPSWKPNQPINYYVETGGIMHNFHSFYR